MKKQNFILIPSFSANSIILKGLISRLSDYFEVYTLDYPGYISNTSPLKKYSILSVVNKLENDIEKLNLKSYIIGGVSMGYLFANNIKKKCCKGKVGMFPLVSNKCIKISPFKQLIFKLGLRTIILTKTQKLIWTSKPFRSMFLEKMFPKDIHAIINDEINPESFFGMANLIINCNYEIQNNKTPHVIVINEYDYAIKSSLTMNIVNSKIPNKIVIKSGMPHNPNSIDKKVFNKYLDDSKMNMIVKYFNNYM